MREARTAHGTATHIAHRLCRRVFQKLAFSVLKTHRLCSRISPLPLPRPRGSSAAAAALTGKVTPRATNTPARPSPPTLTDRSLTVPRSLTAPWQYYSIQHGPCSEYNDSKLRAVRVFAHTTLQPRAFVRRATATTAHLRCVLRRNTHQARHVLRPRRAHTRMTTALHSC